MNVLRLITKRSVRDTLENRFRLYYVTENYEPGDLIEVIDGNRKSPALVVDCGPIGEYKQAIRQGNLQIEKIVFSKSGPNAHGVIVDQLEHDLLQQYLESPSSARSDTRSWVRAFFPRTATKKPVTTQSKKIAASTDGTMAGLSMDRYVQKKESRSPATELQMFVGEVRDYFKDDAKFGQGSFSYYLGFCKKIPMVDLWQIFGEAKQSKKSLLQQKKIFWWKIGQYVRKEPKENTHDSE